MFVSFQKLAAKLSHRPSKVFLIDACGAGVSALFLGLVLPRFEAVFGMPRPVLKVLAVLAAVLALYSFSCVFLAKDRWRQFLIIIMWTNAMYGVLSAILVFCYLDDLHSWGFLYFSVELVLLVALVYLEWLIIKSR